MNKNAKALKKLCSKINPFSKFFLKITLILYLLLILSAILSHLTQSFELLLLQDDFLAISRSVISTGVIGAAVIEYIDKR